MLVTVQSLYANRKNQSNSYAETMRKTPTEDQTWSEGKASRFTIEAPNENHDTLELEIILGNGSLWDVLFEDYAGDWIDNSSYLLGLLARPGE